MLNASLENDDFTCLVLKYQLILFIQKSLIKYLFNPFDFFYKLLKRQSRKSRKAVAVQNCTQLDDPGLNFYFHHNNVDQAHCTTLLDLILFWKFALLFCILFQFLLLLLFYWKK